MEILIGLVLVGLFLVLFLEGAGWLALDGKARKTLGLFVLLVGLWGGVSLFSIPYRFSADPGANLFFAVALLPLGARMVQAK